LHWQGFTGNLLPYGYPLVVVPELRRTKNLCFTAVDVVIVTCALRTITTFVSFPRTNEKVIASRIPHGHYRANTDTFLALRGL